MFEFKLKSFCYTLVRTILKYCNILCTHLLLVLILWLIVCKENSFIQHAHCSKIHLLPSSWLYSYSPCSYLPTSLRHLANLCFNSKIFFLFYLVFVFLFFQHRGDISTGCYYCIIYYYTISWLDMGVSDINTRSIFIAQFRVN